MKLLRWKEKNLITIGISGIVDKVGEGASGSIVVDILAGELNIKSGNFSSFSSKS